MDIHLGTAAYDIRFERQKAAQDIAGIEAEWNAALERIRSKASGIIGFGGGGGSGGTHNGAVAGGGQPVSQVAANGNGASRASAAVNGAAAQNDMLAAAAKNPAMRAAYFSANQATIAPSMAAQLGVTTQELASAMTGGGGGASVVIRNANNQQARQTQFYSAQGERRPTGTGYNLDALDDAIPRQMKQAQERVRQTQFYSANGDRKPTGTGYNLDALDSSIPRQMKEMQEGLSRDSAAANESDKKLMAEGVALVRRRMMRIAVAGLAAANAVGNAAGAFNQYLGENLSAGSDPFRRELATLHGVQSGVGGAVPIVGPMAASIGGAIDNLRYKSPLVRRLTGFADPFNMFTGDPGRSEIALSEKAQNLQFRVSDSTYRTQTGFMRATSPSAAMVASPFGARYNEIEARRDFDQNQTRIERFKALLGATTQEQRDTIERNYSDRQAEIYRRAGFETRGNSSALALSSAALRGSNRQMELSNQLRPMAGLAEGTQIEATATFKEQMREASLINNEEARARVVENVKLEMKGKILGLEGSRMDVLKNIYGGRPEEIGGFQSVEARRDISPETNQARFDALTKAIEALTATLNKP